MHKLKSIWTRFLFMDLSPLIRKGKTKILEIADFPPLPAALEPKASVADDTGLDWSTDRRLLRSLAWRLRKPIGIAAAYNLAGALLSLLGPHFVYQFIALIRSGIHTEKDLREALFYAVMLGLSGFLSGALFQQFFYNMLKSFQLAINTLNHKIFSHSLKLSLEARQKSLVGDIVNHMSADTDATADMGAALIPDTINTLVVLIAVTTMLFFYIGWSALGALAVLVCLAPITKKIAKNFSDLDDELMARRDHRVSVMAQAMNAIRVVKYFAWEKSVYKEVQTIRNKELQSRKKLAQSELLATVMYVSVSTVVLFVALGTHALRGFPLPAELVFACIALFNLLQEYFGNLSRLISRIASAFVSAGRISKFVSQPTVDVDIVSESRLGASQDLRLQFEDFSCSYENSKPILSNLSFSLEAGESLAIVGPVGSGKSTLLLSILGEIADRRGALRFFRGGRSIARPKIAFVPQEAYIVNESLRENIIFGNENTARLSEALTVACLERDLLQLPHGLDTEIGEKGVNLSGGQKQRVSLARAYMQTPELVLLDDPLSAVDVKTENFLVDRLIFGAWKSHLRIVVTHRLESLNRFDKVLFLKDGKIECFGTLAHLQKASAEFRDFYTNHDSTQGHGAPEATTEMPLKIDSPQAPLTKESGRVTEDEDRSLGAVKGSVYLDYLKSLGGENAKTRPWVISILGFFILACALFPLIQKGWLAYSSNIQSGKPLDSTWLIATFEFFKMRTFAEQSLLSVLWYGIFGILTFLAILLSDMTWLSRGIVAGRDLHDKMLRSVLAAPVRFFDSTPVGRILQRFSRDIESVDIHVMFTFENTLACFFHVVMSVILIVTILPLTLVLIAPLMVLYYFLQKNYRASAREAKRLDSIARSPRYAHFKETLQGLTVIRAYSKQEWFMEQFYQKLSHSQRMFYGHYMLNRWFSSRIPLIGGVVAVSTTLCIVFAAYQGVMSAGMAGLLTIYSLSFWGYLNWGVRIFAELEARLTSVERIKFFSNLESEKSVYREPEIVLDSNWPRSGKIEFINVQARYAAHLPLVLKNISFSIPTGARAGFVGRTGAGKSTLFQALYRFIEIEAGQILLDGVDLSRIPLEHVRKNLAIIPQDPILFMGTILSNLDRYNEYGEEKIWSCLEKAGLAGYVKSLLGGLNAPVTENGHNLSQGQRQLLCLARALLVEAKVIVLDEATASVDVQTDALLQKVIRESCKGITLLIIAHRLGTVADCDLIIEIEDGVSRKLEKRTELNPETLS